MITKAEVLNTEVTVKTDVRTKVDLIKQYGNTSGAIRGLTAEGMERKDVAKMLGIRYQHVRNVLITPIKRAAVITTK